MYNASGKNVSDQIANCQLAFSLIVACKFPIITKITKNFIS